MQEAECIYTELEVEAAIIDISKKITVDMAHKNPLVLCVMNGGLVFTGKLLTYLKFPLESSYLHASRYHNETIGGKLFWKVKPEVSLVDRAILIVDDILDEGHTLSAIIDFCKSVGASCIKTAVLINKTHDRKATESLKADYEGLSCIDRYVFGYGMDYKGYWRNAAGIYAVKGL